jgi:hypothetical protein
LPIFECKGIKAKCRMSILSIGIRHSCASSNLRSCARKSGPAFL